MKEHLERFHPSLAGKHILFVDRSMFTPGFVSHMTRLEKMKVTQYDNLQYIPDLANCMESKNIDFAIIHNIALGEADKIIEAVKRGKIIIVQEKNSDIELNLKFNQQLQNAGVKTFPRCEPDLDKAFRRCLDYLATLSP
ncbi:MAG: hypothetical protein WC503_02255 [Candidatus Shapirobacteria bacterium]